MAELLPSPGPTTDKGVLLGTNLEDRVNINLTYIVFHSSIQTKSQSQKNSTLLPRSLFYYLTFLNI